MVAMESDQPTVTKGGECREEEGRGISLDSSDSGPGMDFDAFIDQEYNCHNDFDMCVRPVSQAGPAGQLMFDLLRNSTHDGANVITENAIREKESNQRVSDLKKPEDDLDSYKDDEIGGRTDGRDVSSPGEVWEKQTIGQGVGLMKKNGQEEQSLSNNDSCSVNRSRSRENSPTKTIKSQAPVQRIS